MDNEIVEYDCVLLNPYIYIFKEHLGGILLFILRGILLIFGIISMILGWVITGPYLFITAIYSPLWKRKEPFDETMQNRPKFILRFFARLLDYIILSLFFGVLAAVVEVVFPTSVVPIERFFAFIFLGYVLISLYFFRKTIGDKLLKLELSTYEGERKVSFFQIFLRTFFAPIGAIQGLVSVRNSNKYLVHDRVSNTDMIRKVS